MCDIFLVVVSRGGKYIWEYSVVVFRVLVEKVLTFVNILSS